MKKGWLWAARVLLFAALIGVDQWVKQAVINGFEAKGKLPLASVLGLLDITYTRNTGAAFSMFSNAGWFFVVAAMIAVAVIAVILVKGWVTNAWGTWSLVLIAAGATGNCVDRLFRGGAVVDMFELTFIDFAVFNVADLTVTAGAICLFIYLFFYFDTERKKQAEEPIDDSAEAS